MGIKTSKNDIIWSYLSIFVSLCSNIIVLPITIYYLDSETLGLWYVFLSLGGIVTLFDFGFNPTFSRNITYCWSGAEKLKKNGIFNSNKGNPNYFLLQKVMYACKKIYLIIALCALTLLLTLGSIYISYVSRNIPGNEKIIAWILYSIAVFLNLYYGYFSSFLRGIGSVEKANKANVISKIFNIVIMFILLFLGYGILAVSLAYCLSGFIFRTISKKYFFNVEGIRNNIKNNKIKFKFVELKDIYDTIWPNAWREGIVAVSNYLSNQASTLICSAFLTLTEAGIYSISIQIISCIVTVSGALYTAYQPELQAAQVSKDLNKLKRLMSTAMFIYLVLFLVGILSFIIIGRPLLNIIKPNTIIDVKLIIVTGIYQFLLTQHTYYASYISNSNYIPYVKAFLISSITGTIFTVVLIKVFNFGIWGLIIAPLIVQLIYNNWNWPYRVLKSLNITPLQMLVIGYSETFSNIKKLINKQ
ncbi:O-unit flippase-like protein [Clostridium sp.]|uniref:O-unit flippase-like protein n=1 Tax=Clostridium sp. TaxID=1506 RepID=UPI0026396C3E|nr:O-unit flippase-like protein [Clostridium sp.]